ncbi:hypothetical protein [Dinoroseobacter sp. S76]|uniref:hypothetical protein n=1 Tax=Dinoroseobacter sp. S76 TaxID=3415124 RepID=UPI003C7AE733
MALSLGDAYKIAQREADKAGVPVFICQNGDLNTAIFPAGDPRINDGWWTVMQEYRPAR